MQEHNANMDRAAVGMIPYVGEAADALQAGWNLGATIDRATGTPASQAPTSNDMLAHHEPGDYDVWSKAPTGQMGPPLIPNMK
jgi:hypothetical protein